MPAVPKHFDSFEVRQLKDLLESIDPAVRVRGYTYYEANNVLEVTRKGEALEARVLGSSSNIYNVWIAFEEMDYFCDCPAALPCKHIASVAIWALGLSETSTEGLENYTARSLTARENEGESELVCVFNEEHSRISLYAKDPEGQLKLLEEASQYRRLKAKWQDSLSAFMKKQRRNSHLYIEESSFPLYELVEHFHHRKGEAIPEYRDQKEQARPLSFAGFLGFDALVYDTQLSGKFGPDSEYELLLYYFDPLRKVYREVQPTEPLVNYDPDPDSDPDSWRASNYEWEHPFEAQSLSLSVNHALVSSEAPLSEREKNLQKVLQNIPAAESLKEASSAAIEERTKSKVESKDEAAPKGSPEGDAFYLLRARKRVLEKLSLFDYRIPYKNINSLYYDLKLLTPFIPNDLSEHIAQAYEAGPALAISMYVDETEAKPKIKGKVELIYAQNKRYLKPQYWKKKNKELLTKLIFGFPPAKIFHQNQERNFLLQHSINHQLIKRNLLKERNLLNKKDIPFRYRKVDGNFEFGSRFLKKFATDCLPILKKQDIVMRLHQSLVPFIERMQYSSTFTIESSSGTDWFQGELRLEGVSKQDQAAILAAYRKKEELLKLSNGSWVLTSAFNLDNIHKALEELGISLSQKGKTGRFTKGQFIALEQSEEQFFALRAGEKAEELRRNFQNLSLKKDDFNLELSPALQKTLRPYQEEGCAFFYRLFQLQVGGILADDMGLGKTLQTLTFIDALWQEKRRGPFLVVGPLAALGVWQEECQKFIPHMPTQIWHGSKLKKEKSEGELKKDETFLDAGIIITTYTTLSQNVEKFAKLNFTSVFLDEAQNIKNISTQNAKAVRKLNSSGFFCLTGTPIENHIGELWALMELCFPGLLGSKKYFKQLHGVGQDVAARDILLKRISPFVLRRRKQEVLKDLPEKTETLIKLDLHETQALVYEQVRKEALIALADAGNQYLMVMLPYLMRLRRICCHPDLKNKHLPDISLSSKFGYLKDNLEKIADSSSGTLIFSQFTDVLDMVGAFLEQEKYEFFYINGATGAAKRQKIVKKFQAGERPFFLISLKAGGTALTLHRADTIIHLDPWWNPAAEDQATDRAHRIGQTRKVSVYKLISKNSVEEKVLRLQDRKKKLFNSIFNEEAGGSSHISRQDLAEILEDAVF